MSGQPDLFDYAASRKGKDEALKRVEENAEDSWLVDAERIVMGLAKERREFTSDDVWQAGLREPREPRALGAVMNRLARLGLIVKTGRFIETARKTRHHAPIAVWRGSTP